MEIYVERRKGLLDDIRDDKFFFLRDTTVLTSTYESTFFYVILLSVCLGHQETTVQTDILTTKRTNTGIGIYSIRLFAASVLANGTDE